MDLRHHVVSPRYRIEMTRRADALADLQLAQLARLAARAEGLDGDRLESLIEAGLLPSDFLKRPDGSRHPKQPSTVPRRPSPVNP
ncbi:MAG: hypothetical protein ACYTG0_06425 [Planctomycetota bacterium]|jgi:hypothetical protein